MANLEKKVEYKIRKSRIEDWSPVWNWMKDLSWSNVGRETGVMGYKMKSVHQIVAVDENGIELCINRT